MSYSNCQFTWLKQKETLVSLAESLLKDETYFDCQFCAEGHRFNVHRVILSCNSPVLSSILQDHYLDLPVITLEGVSSVEVEALIEFMYTGVTKISSDYLKNFFQLARSLELAGLTHYDNAQIYKIIDESSLTALESNSPDGCESYNENILKYLEQTDSNGESQTKHLTAIDQCVESIFLDESQEQNAGENGSSIIYEKYDGTFIKDDVEALDPNLVENDDLSTTCNPVDTNAIETNETDSPLMYNKFSGVFIKSEEDSMNEEIATVYSISEFDEMDSVEKEEEEDSFNSFQRELKVTEEDENFVYVKVDNSSLVKVRQSQLRKTSKQNIMKNDIRLYSEKCLKVINPMEKNYLVKRPKIQSLLQKDARTNANDKKIYICLKCGNKYSHRRTLLHHIHWICEQPATYSCSLCPYRGKRKFQLKSHMKHAHLLKMS